MTNPKKPREPRKPLDQSFLDFVHQKDPEPGPEPSEPDNTIAQLAQELMELQRRFGHLERAATDQDPHHLSQLEDQLRQLTQQFEQMEMNANQPLIELQQQLDNFSKTLLDREFRHFSQVEQQLTHLAQHVEQLGADLRQLGADLQHRFIQSEAAAAESTDHHHVSQTEQSTQPIPLTQPEESSDQPPTPRYPDEAFQSPSTSDSLLSWLGPLLDDF